MTESPKSPPRPAGPPPPPQRGAGKPADTASLPHEPARDTLAPSSFGVLGSNKPVVAPAPAPMRGARAPLPTLGDLEGATATATLRPPGAVPPPPRALPTATPPVDSAALERGSPVQTPLPRAASGDRPFTALAADLAPSLTPRTRAEPTRGFESSTVVSAGAAEPRNARPPVDATLDSTLDMNGTASKKATQAALIEQTRISESDAGKSPAERVSAVPAPGLFIADEPLEPRPQQPSLVTQQRELLTRMRIVVIVLGGLFLMAAGALVVLIFRRVEATANRSLVPSASAAPALPGCTLSAPPSRISPIERSVPISAIPLADGSIALAIADTKTSAAGWIYDPLLGEPKRKLEAPNQAADVSHVTATDPLLIDRASPDFAFGQTIGTGLALGVGPAGLLRRGQDGATGVVWPLGAGVRVTPPRFVATPNGYFVAFRQGGAEGQIITGWLGTDGSAASSAAPVDGAPKNLGTPNVAAFGAQALVLFPGRTDKSEPYRVYVAAAAAQKPASTPRALDLPLEGGGALAPSLALLPGNRYLVQWTDGNVGQYQVHVRVLDDTLHPISEPLLVSAKGANAGQGTVVTTAQAAVSFFIQTTAGHDELWGVALSCR